MQSIRYATVKPRHTRRVSIPDRLADADLLWQQGHREGALLAVLVAVSATARRTLPDVKGDGEAFVQFLKTAHRWTLGVEHRGASVDLDLLFYKWLRCELVHNAALPSDVRFENLADDPMACSVRAGGAPEYVAIIGHGWYHFLVNAVRDAPANAGLFAGS